MSRRWQALLTLEESADSESCDSVLVAASDLWIEELLDRNVLQI